MWMDSEGQKERGKTPTKIRDRLMPENVAKQHEKSWKDTHSEPNLIIVKYAIKHFLSHRIKYIRWLTYIKHCPHASFSCSFSLSATVTLPHHPGREERIQAIY